MLGSFSFGQLLLSEQCPTTIGRHRRLRNGTDCNVVRASNRSEHIMPRVSSMILNGIHSFLATHSLSLRPMSVLFAHATHFSSGGRRPNSFHFRRVRRPRRVLTPIRRTRIRSLLAAAQHRHRMPPNGTHNGRTDGKSPAVRPQSAIRSPFAAHRARAEKSANHNPQTHKHTHTHSNAQNKP